MTQHNIIGVTRYVWLTITILSTVITIYAIFVLQSTVRVLRASNPHLKLSFCNVYFAQCVFYTLNLMIVIGYIVTNEAGFPSKVRNQLSFIVPVFDLMGQVLICYICWTQGNSKQIKQFSCALVPDRNGGMRL